MTSTPVSRCKKRKTSLKDYAKSEIQNLRNKDSNGLQQNSDGDNVKKSKTCEETLNVPSPNNLEALQLNTEMHNIIVPVKKNGTVSLPLSYLKARQALFRNKKVATNTNIITVRSTLDKESRKREESELVASRKSSDPSSSSPGILAISNSFAVPASEENKRTIILNPTLGTGYLPKRKLQDGFFAQVPDKNNPGKSISCFVIPTESSLSEIIMRGKLSSMGPLRKERLSYLVEPLPQPDFIIPIGDDTPAGEVVKQLSKNKFSSRLLLDAYLKSLVEDSDNRLVFPCKKCGIIFLQKKLLHIHFEEEHAGESLYECILCKESFTSFKLLEDHKNTFHKENNTCEICGRSFQTHWALVSHLKRLHTSDTCDVCGYHNLVPHQMENHKIKHYRDADFLKKSLFDFDQKKPWCDVCNIGLESDKHLEFHNRIKHKGELKEEKP